MGIFSESTQQDVEAISHFINASLEVFSLGSAERPGLVDYEVTSSGDFEYISTTGARILQDLPFDNALVRVAALLVLCNAAPPFSITRKGKPCLDFAGRKHFLANFTCLLVHAALSTMEIDRPNGAFVLRWGAFPNDTFKEEFIEFLQRIGPAHITPDRQGRAKRQEEETYLKTLAAKTIGCALALHSCVKEEPVRKPQRLTS